MRYRQPTLGILSHAWGSGTPIVRYRLEYLPLGPSGALGLPAQPSTRTRPSDHPHLAALPSAAEELVGAVGFEP